MAWTGLTLTVDGRNALNQAQLANEISFKSIVVGDGMPPPNYHTQTALVHQLYEITDIKIDVTDVGCNIVADFPKVDTDYYFREVGVIVSTSDGDKLYVYDNCGEDAQYIVISTGAETTQKRVRLSLVISDVANISVTQLGLLYVSYEDFEIGMDGKVDKEEGKGLSSNDYTTDEKEKLAGLGRVLVGTAGTQLNNNDTLFIIDNGFDGAAYTNVVFNDNSAYVTDTENADTQSEDGLITGKLAVSEDATEDAVFLAKINS